ncbi:MAG: hypothetical protein ACYCZ6_04345 [Polaromonas sp.]
MRRVTAPAGRPAGTVKIERHPRRRAADQPGEGLARTRAMCPARGAMTRIAPHPVWNCREQLLIQSHHRLFEVFDVVSVPKLCAAAGAALGQRPGEDNG